MKQLFTFFASLAMLVSFAQMSVTPNSNANQLAQYLAGPGVVISNAVINCPSGGAGFFNGASAGLGISDGVVLTNGLANEANLGSAFFASNSFAGNGDPDLNAILSPSGLVSTDVCVLEFDITVTGDSLIFSYVFGSEEYNGFVCNGYNDVFAFFISGPNPNGGNYISQNVALIPGTNTPVSINTVNNGNPNGFDPGCQTFNTQYYNGTPLADVSYEGRTNRLTAEAEVVPCATYHFKLAVGDGSPLGFGDDVFDSGVFLEEGSFTSNAITLGASSILGGNYNYLIEGCLEGVFTFDVFTNGGTSDTLIDFILGGTATNGVDYLFIDEQLIFNGNDTSISISIIPLNDNLIEGTETIILYLLNQSCSGGIIDTAVIEIADNIAISVTPPFDSLCNGDSLLLVATGGDSYAWSPAGAVTNLTDSFTYASPSASLNIQLISTLGNCIDTTLIPLSVGNLSVLNSTLANESCPGESDGFIAMSVNQNIGPVSYLWSSGDTTNAIVGLSAGLYAVQISDLSGCVIDLTFVISQPSLFLNALSADSSICLGELVQLSVEDSLNDPLYYWEANASLSNDSIANPTSQPSQSLYYYLSATVNGNCTIEDSVFVEVKELVIAPFFTDTIVGVGDVVNVGVNLLTFTNISSAITYSWTPIDFLAQTNQSQSLATIMNSIVYNIYAEGEGCKDTAQIVVSTEISYDIPNAFSPNNDGINDLFQVVNLSGGSIREFKIYNQWGDLIYNGIGPWDGTYQGVAQPAGVYTYYVRFTNIGQEIIESGMFTLIY
jgi:gliding motility-associated-like protein